MALKHGLPESGFRGRTEPLALGVVTNLSVRQRCPLRRHNMLISTAAFCVRAFDFYPLGSSQTDLETLVK